MRKIARREDLLEQLEETVFALMMEEVVRVEGRKALEENERLKADESFVVPEETYRKGLYTIKSHFSKNTKQTAMRTMSKLISRVAVIVLILLLLFTTAFATIPELRTKTLNLIMEVFDDRTRIEFGEVEQRASVSESESDHLVGWVPEGFELVDKGETEFTIRETYENLHGATIEVCISLAAPIWELDTENAAVEDTVVNGVSATMIFKRDTIQLVCPMVKSERVCYVKGAEVTEDIIIRVAESVVLC